MQFRAKDKSVEAGFSSSPITEGANTSTLVQYLGIAIDEPKRLERLDGINKLSPLAAIGWTEADCREWCEKNDLLSPIYTTSTRGGVLVLPQSRSRPIKAIEKQLSRFMGIAYEMGFRFSRHIQG